MMPPPTAPRIVEVNAYFAVMSWELIDERFEFSSLEYDFQIALVPISFSEEEVSDSSNFEWLSATTRRRDILPSKYGDEQYNCNCVLIDKLSPSTSYIARVRIRTVAGWTVWSDTSKIFRTLSPP